jgi:NAD(P)-dependent dehydrogenase (short-subunit alcohol dehydrogenase family)
MTGLLAGKVALVTGGTTGIGRAVVDRFVHEGARVVSLARGTVEGSNKNAWGENVTFVAGNARSAVDNQRAVDAAIGAYGRLDVLVANAGIYDGRRQFLDYSIAELEASFDELFSLNVKGYMLAARIAADALARARGCIIFSSSISGENAGFGGALYVSAKHAINGLTKQLALEFAPHIRVNAVAPGYVPTQIRTVSEPNATPSVAGPCASSVPLQVIAPPEDFAAAYAFLASDACSRTASGTILKLDGGSTLFGPSPIGPRRG